MPVVEKMAPAAHIYIAQGQTKSLGTKGPRETHTHNVADKCHGSTAAERKRSLFRSGGVGLGCVNARPLASLSGHMGPKAYGTQEPAGPTHTPQ